VSLIVPIGSRYAITIDNADYHKEGAMDEEQLGQAAALIIYDIERTFGLKMFATEEATIAAHASVMARLRAAYDAGMRRGAEIVREEHAAAATEADYYR
jgi:hypothetical protein